MHAWSAALHGDSPMMAADLKPLAFQACSHEIGATAVHTTRMGKKGKIFALTHKEALNKSDFVMTLRCSQKISPYLSCICCVDIFCSRLVSFRTRTYSELP
jgi:hypothetical protein